MNPPSSQPPSDKKNNPTPQKKPAFPSKALDKTMDIPASPDKASLSSMKTMDIPQEEFSKGSTSHPKTAPIPSHTLNKGNISAMKTIDLPPENPGKSASASMKTMDIPQEKFSNGSSSDPSQTVRLSKEDENSFSDPSKTVRLDSEEECFSPDPIKTFNFPQGGDTSVLPSTSQKKNPNQTTIVQPQSLSSSSSSEPQPGEMIGDFQVVKKLGEGGMGAVYKCFDVALKRYVALKLLRPRYSQNVQFRARFEVEAQAVAQLRHPNIIQVFRAGEDKSRKCLYFAMDFIEGQGLDTLIEKKQKLSVEETLHYVEQSAEALKYSHKKNILHRDIKPANIMITKDNHALLADFGLAKFVGSSENTEESAAPSEEPASNNAYLTQKGSVVGTPHYLSPERIDGINDDKRSDIYALGIVLYHCLTGTPPFMRNSVIEILNAHKLEEPTPLEQILPSCPKDVVQIFKKSTAKRLEDRYPTIDAMLESLKEIQRAKERKREIAEKKQLSQDVASALIAAKIKPSVPSSRSFIRRLGPVFAIFGVLSLLAYFLYPNDTQNSSSKTPEIMETRELDINWVHGKKCRLAGKLVKITEPEDKSEKITLTINTGFLENTEPDEHDILFTPGAWETIQKTHPLSCKIDYYVVFQGKAVVNPDEIPYLEGQVDSPIAVPVMKKYHFQENLTVPITAEFPENLDDEYVQVNGMIFNIQEYEEELIIVLTDLNQSHVNVSITPKTLSDIEKRKYSPRVGDEVYAIGRLTIKDDEDENGKQIFTYTIYVDDNKGEFFSMNRTNK